MKFGSLGRATTWVSHTSPSIHLTRALRTNAEPNFNMSWRCSGASNDELIDNMYNAKIIKDDRVRDAFKRVDRKHYSPRNPYADSPQRIRDSPVATISAPHMHAYACHYLVDYLLPSRKPTSPVRILDIGSGSGYLTHVMAELAGSENDTMVVGLEHIQELTDLGEANMGKSASGKRLLETGSVRFRFGDGRKGWVEDGEAGWDVIHVGAAAKEAHQELLDQLRAPGCMFIPVDKPGSFGEQAVWKYHKKEDGSIEKENLFGVSYVPLTDAPKV